MMRRWAAWWRRRATLRLKTAVAAVLVTGVALAIAALAVLSLVREDISNRLQQTVRNAVDRVAEQLAAGVQPDQITLGLPVGGQGFGPPLVQVIDLQTGETVQEFPPVSPGALRTSPGPTLGPASQTPAPLDLPPGSKLISYEQDLVTPDGRRLRVTASTSALIISENTATLRTSLAIGFPVLAALAGVITWLVTRSSLRHVERIRAQVEVISAQTLNRRVTNPPADDEIGRLAQTMNHMLDRLELASRRQREFVSDASHELRSPVAAIRTELEVALKDPNVANWIAVANDALAENARLERLVDDLLTLARLDEGQIPKVEDVDLDDVAREEIARLRDPRIVADVQAVRVRGSYDQLARALRNLLENARRYARQRIDVSVSAESGAAVLAVADDGPGIPPEHRDHAFERFSRLDEDRSRTHGGAGLGLAVVRAIAENHGGTAEAAENDEGGARLVIRLPLGVGMTL